MCYYAATTPPTDHSSRPFNIETVQTKIVRQRQMLGFHTFINQFNVVYVNCVWFQNKSRRITFVGVKAWTMEKTVTAWLSRMAVTRSHRRPCHSDAGENTARLSFGDGNGPIFCWATLLFPKSSIVVVTSGRVVTQHTMLMACACVITQSVEKLFGYIRIYHSSIGLSLHNNAWC